MRAPSGSESPATGLTAGKGTVAVGVAPASFVVVAGGGVALDGPAVAGGVGTPPESASSSSPPKQAITNKASRRAGKNARSEDVSGCLLRSNLPPHPE
jgi:hypothetical protein